MYNVERKELFKKTLTKRYAIPFAKICDISEAMETRLDKDISEFTDDEVIELLKSFDNEHMKTVTSYKFTLSRYTKWCRNNGYSSAPNAYNHITREQMLSSVNTSKSLSYDDVINAIHLLSNPSDRAVLWCILYGINGLFSIDILSLKEEDIFGNTVATTSGKLVELPNEAIKDIRESCNTYVYYAKKRPWKFDPYDDHMFKKRIWSKEDSYNRDRNRVKNKLKTISELIGKDMNPTQIRQAGIVHFIQKIIQDNPGLDSYTVFNHPDFLKVKEQYDLTGTNRSVRYGYMHLI